MAAKKKENKKVEEPKKVEVPAAEEKKPVESAWFREFINKVQKNG